MQRLPRLVELLLIVLLCGVVAYWVTRSMRGPSIAVPPPAGLAAPGGDGRAAALLASARLFGSRPPGVLSDNVRALGVIADAAGGGSVIVSVDGQPAKVYRVGDTLDGRLVDTIRSDEIELETGGARQVFRLPPRTSAGGVNVAGAATGPAVPVPVLQQAGDAAAAGSPDTSAPPPGRVPRGVRRPHFDANGVPDGSPAR